MYSSDAASIILEYMNMHLFPPTFQWDKLEFRKRSYQQWAAYEIIERILDRPLDRAIDIIDDFMFEMYAYACCSDEDKNRTFIFQTAVETAEELALLFV